MSDYVLFGVFVVANALLVYCVAFTTYTKLSRKSPRYPQLSVNVKEPSKSNRLPDVVIPWVVAERISREFRDERPTIAGLVADAMRRAREGRQCQS